MTFYLPTHLMLIPLLLPPFHLSFLFYLLALVWSLKSLLKSYFFFFFWKLWLFTSTTWWFQVSNQFWLSLCFCSRNKLRTWRIPAYFVQIQKRDALLKLDQWLHSLELQTLWIQYLRLELSRSPFLFYFQSWTIPATESPLTLNDEGFRTNSLGFQVRNGKFWKTARRIFFWSASPEECEGFNNSRLRLGLWMKAASVYSYKFLEIHLNEFPLLIAY